MQTASRNCSHSIARARTPLRLDLLLPQGDAGTLDLNGPQIGPRGSRPAERPARPSRSTHRESGDGQALGLVVDTPCRESLDRYSRLAVPVLSGIPRLDSALLPAPRPCPQPRMNPNYLDFEQPIADLEAKIQELRHASTGPAVNIDAEIHALEDKLRRRTAQIFRDLSAWQVSQLARHPARPYTLDYLRRDLRRIPGTGRRPRLRQRQRHRRRSGAASAAAA